MQICVLKVHKVFVGFQTRNKFSITYSPSCVDEIQRTICGIRD